MADQDFARREGGGAPTSKVGVPTYYLAKIFPKKLYENEKLDQKGRTRPWRHPPPLDPPMVRECWAFLSSLQPINNIALVETGNFDETSLMYSPRELLHWGDTEFYFHLR